MKVGVVWKIHQYFYLTFHIIIPLSHAEELDSSAGLSTLFSAEALSNTIIRLTEGLPSAIIMDNWRLANLGNYRGNIKLDRATASTYFIYKPFMQQQDRAQERVKPNPWRTSYKHVMHYGWVFICFLELSHSPASLDIYLQKLLRVGNARKDHFIFIGSRYVIQPLLENHLMKKFRNVIGIEINNFLLSAHYRKTCRNTGKSDSAQFSLTNDLSLPNWIRRWENCLGGHNFRVAGTDFPPFMYFIRPDDNPPSHTWEYKGINYQILTNGAAKYNYSITLQHPTEWQLMGEKQPNGKWDGVFGDLVYDRAEIASVSNPTDERNGLADFIGPFGKSDLVFMSANPLTYAKAGAYAIFHPFPHKIWIVLIVGFFCVWLVHSVAFEIRHSLGKEKYSDTVRKAFMVMMAFTLEQEMKKPKGAALRFIMIVWVSFMIIMGTSYKYNLASYIVSPQPDYVPKSFEELYDLPEYNIIFDLGGVSGWNYFRTNPDRKIKALTLRANETEDTSMCTVRAFQEVSTVCAGWDFTLTFASSKNLTINLGREALYRSKPLFEAWFVFATGSNSVFTNEFMNIGRMFFEFGLVTYWESNIILTEKYRGKRWIMERKGTGLYRQLEAFNVRSSRSILAKLDWWNVQFTFVIFGVGIVLSSFVFLGEYFYGNDRFRKMFDKRRIRIRKISKIVRRKISGELVLSNAAVMEPKSKEGLAASQAPIITVTFLP